MTVFQPVLNSEFLCHHGAIVILAFSVGPEAAGRNAPEWRFLLQWWLKAAICDRCFASVRDPPLPSPPVTGES